MGGFSHDKCAKSLMTYWKVSVTFGSVFPSLADKCEICRMFLKKKKKKKAEKRKRGRRKMEIITPFSIYFIDLTKQSISY